MSAPVLVFDLDDTLYLERDFARSGFAALDDYLNSSRGLAGFAEACSRKFDAGIRGNIFNAALEELGCAEEDTFIHELVNLYRSHEPRISLADDARIFLDNNRQPLALITDGPAATQNAKIDGLGIRSTFGHIVTTGAWPKGFGKPHPRSFKQVMAWSGQKAGDHIYIADNPAKDFLAPRDLGWRTVQINREGRVHDPVPPSLAHCADNEIETLDQLAGVLAL
ncbi:hypothetical protein CP97_06115 [Aurantiacibacter atlanticus]|uniref:Hydrolase of the HAD superfamily n=2 Tax=Aurantiacibacter atlanticus TaxID=1648404 RepID=A0A0H4VAT2_9SPHN|nr:hypothetical protein CP97_06115 [Aurantiacibacter atlanticus]MDF1833364.1 HAD family hydrolase [Alteraurantiacibacter sp. bin_em_oilr2.035]